MSNVLYATFSKKNLTGNDAGMALAGHHATNKHSSIRFCMCSQSMCASNSSLLGVLTRDRLSVFRVCDCV